MKADVKKSKGVKYLIICRIKASVGYVEIEMMQLITQYANAENWHKRNVRLSMNRKGKPLRIVQEGKNFAMLKKTTLKRVKKG